MSKLFFQAYVMDLKQESERATEMLKGKVVNKVLRDRKKEVGIEFTDGTRLFVDAHDGEVELSITGGSVKEISD